MPEMPSDLALAKTAALFATFANEGRLRALVALSRHGPLSVTELMPHCGLEQSALSHQLGLLRSAGLVSTQRRGKNVIYALADDHVRSLLDDGLAHATEDESTAAGVQGGRP
jgi:DNA-binding transcriptional ArsR family regulator